jgi:large subunit ribosomal protein L17
MLAGLASALFRDERIRTTETKAKRLRPVAERLITLGKNGSVHARRQALAVVEDRDVIHKLFAEIAPRYTERTGGYTRILKLGPRKGDAAPMALIELVEGEAPAARADDEEAPRRGLRRRRGRTGRRSRRAEGETSESPEAASEAPEGDSEEGDRGPEPDVPPPSDEGEPEATTEVPAEAAPAAEPSPEE